MLKILYGRDGSMRGEWYVRYRRNGMRVDANLHVPIRGKVPLDAKGQINLLAKGDAEFEKSRKEALKAFSKLQATAKGNQDTADLYEAAIRMRTGKPSKGLPLDDLAKKWVEMKGDSVTEDRKKSSTTKFNNFVTFAKLYAAKSNYKCNTLDDITPELTIAWRDDLKKKYAWDTVKDYFHLLSGAWERWHYRNTEVGNPFKGILGKNNDAKHAPIPHEGLTEEQIERLYDVSRSDEFFYPLIVCAACTGMRIGDVCNLKWASVDLKNRVIDAITSKTGTPITLPIFERLLPILELANTESHNEFVFPKAAEMYNGKKRTRIIRGVKPYFARAVFGDQAKAIEDAQIEGEPLEKKSPEEVLQMIDKANWAEQKRTRVHEIFERFSNGEKIKDIAAAMSLNKGMVSDYLKNVEKLTGETYRPQAKRRSLKCKSKRELTELTRKDREIGQYSGSLYGWHSLRASFVIIALEHGVPDADVKKIVGHTDLNTTLRKYHHPTKAHTIERLHRIEKQMTDGTRNTAKPAIAESSTKVVDVDALFASLTEAQKKALMKKLQGKK